MTMYLILGVTFKFFRKRNHSAEVEVGEQLRQLPRNVLKSLDQALNLGTASGKTVHAG